MTAVAEEAARPQSLATEMPSGRTTGWWGMVLFVTTEATFFAAALGSYFYLRFQAQHWPPPGIEAPKLTKAIIMTAILLPSSVPVMWAEHGIRKGQRWRLRVGLTITLILGIAFLAMQAWEYSEDTKKHTFTTDAYSSLFYGITTFHGLHVAIGSIMVGWLLAASLQGSFGYRRHERVRLVAIYWHFVDVVWVAIFLTLYISPRL